MSKVAVVFWSGTGNTEAMANAVVEGIKGAGADAEIVADLTRAGDIRELAAKLAALPSWQKCAPRGGEKEVTDPAKEAVCSDVRDKYKTIDKTGYSENERGTGTPKK